MHIVTLLFYKRFVIHGIISTGYLGHKYINMVTFFLNCLLFVELKNKFKYN